MTKELNCLRCGTPMRLIKRERLQLGQSGYLMGNLDNLIAGALDVDILACPQCGKLEFFQGGCYACETEAEEGTIAKVRCPHCGKKHEMDDPKCPFCGMKNIWIG